MSSNLTSPTIFPGAHRDDSMRLTRSDRGVSEEKQANPSAHDRDSLRLQLHRCDPSVGVFLYVRMRGQIRCERSPVRFHP